MASHHVSFADGQRHADQRAERHPKLLLRLAQPPFNVTETGNNPNQAYNYDAYGNRWVTGTGWIPYTGLTPTSNQFTGNRWTGSGISYDGSGNQKQVMPSQSFTYDSENRVATATMGTVTTTYAYDGDGRRVQKTVSPASGPPVTTTYVYDAAGNTVAEYGGPTPTVSGTTYLTQDHLGSTRLVTDSSGTPLKRYDYAPFGEDLPSGIDGRNSEYPTGTYPTAAVDALNQKFTSKERDAETGLDWFNVRYFSSAQGRFTSPDWSATPEPIPYADLSNPQSLNLYAYVRNNPLSKSGPTGHCLYPGGNCWDYFVGGVKAVANIPSGVTTAVNLGINWVTGSSIPDAPTLQLTNEDQQRGAEALGAVALVSPLAEAGAAKLANLLSKTEDLVNVGRWMGNTELTKIKSTKTVQESYTGTTHVASPADPPLMDHRLLRVAPM